MARLKKIETVEKTCLMCKSTVPIKLDKKDLKKWFDTGARIQDVMPYLTIDERELLISGICGICYNKIFNKG